MSCENCEYGYVYKLSWFSSKRKTISHTDKYYLNAKNIHKYLTRKKEYGDKDLRCFYIRVLKSSQNYKSAVINSNWGINSPHDQ
jgi:hypothetical protein